jgi:hypothetical protein
VIRVFDEAGNVIVTQEHKGDFQRVMTFHSYRAGVPAKTCFHDFAFVGLFSTAKLNPD